MLENFDRPLLGGTRRNRDWTADWLLQRARQALAAAGRWLGGAGWIDRLIAPLSVRIIQRRLRALVLLQLTGTADRAARDALIARLRRADEVRWVQEIGGTGEVLLMLDCAGRDALGERAAALLAADPSVRRYQSFSVKRELRFAPFARLGS